MSYFKFEIKEIWSQLDTRR